MQSRPIALFRGSNYKFNCTVYIAKIQLKEEMEQAWLEWIGDDPQHWPQRACVEAPLYRYTLVEFVVIAACR